MKRSASPMFDAEQKKFIKEHLLKGAPEFEVQRFLITCERTGLDCFTKQIYAHLQNTKVSEHGKPDRWEKTVVIITSIDGFRAIAERTNEYRGQTPPEWYCMNEESKVGWQDVFITPRDPQGNPMKLPDACRVGVIRKDFPNPVYGVANFESFAKYRKVEEQGEGGRKKTAWYLDLFWKKMPEHMIAKVAEAQAFRKAFPLLACGLYLEEELVSDEVRTRENGEGKDKLPEGAKWVEGHSPEERAAAAKKPAEVPETAPAPETPKPEEKPATGQQEPAEPAPKKSSKGKKEPAAPPSGKVIAKQEELALPGGEPEPQPPKETKEPGGSVAANWKDHVITQITMPSITGKKLGDLPPNEIKRLKVGWVDKYKDRFANNPKKVEEATMIELAFAAQTAK